MREQPSQSALLQGVIDFLQSEAMPQLTGQTAKYISGNFGPFINSPEFETTPPFAEWSPAKRASAAKSPRGSITVTSMPRPCASGTSACAMCTAPMIASRRGGG